MSDLIRREDVMLRVREFIGNKSYDELMLVNDLNALPSADPEREKGKWIEISWSEPDPNVCCTSYAIQSAKCSICGKYHSTPYLYSLDYFPYCPNCGAEMTR